MTDGDRSGELLEPGAVRGGSSNVPHKSNPVVAAAVLTGGRHGRAGWAAAVHARPSAGAPPRTVQDDPQATSGCARYPCGSGTPDTVGWRLDLIGAGDLPGAPREPDVDDPVGRIAEIARKEEPVVDLRRLLRTSSSCSSGRCPMPSSPPRVRMCLAVLSHTGRPTTPPAARRRRRSRRAGGGRGCARRA
jgi:hypothetical protein